MNLSYEIIYGDTLSIMPQMLENSVSLVVTSCPYYDLKDYLDDRQIGYGQTYKQYISDLSRVFRQCYRIIAPGCVFALNYFDVIASKAETGRFRKYPMTADFMKSCINVGFDYMEIIYWWNIKGKMMPGSFPYPNNGVMHTDSEYILIFKKPGKRHIKGGTIKDDSELTWKDWSKYYTALWKFPSVKQDAGHGAIFPYELPKRLIRMFTYVGETVFDPFLGSGTTMKASKDWRRSCIGTELNPDFVDMSKKKVGWGQQSVDGDKIDYIITENIENQIFEMDRLSVESVSHDVEHYNDVKEESKDDIRYGKSKSKWF